MELQLRDGKAEAVVRLLEGWNPPEGAVASGAVAIGVETAKLFNGIELETAPVGMIDGVETAEELDDPIGTPIEADVPDGRTTVGVDACPRFQSVTLKLFVIVFVP